MSKETFSGKISQLMYKKIKSIEYIKPEIFFEKDDDFEVILCLSYMTLSKEKIIKKDMKNTNRMDRLTQMVDTSEIDKVFKPGFANDMPIITYAKENNNLWILDNIRDSIMHGVFEIDEERKCFLIDNKQYDRELVAEIPFSWFIAYAKNDILSKKILDNYTVKGFYYNKNKKFKKYFSTKKELLNNILYKVDISGNKFNVKDIENRIRELFDIYSKEEIDSNLIENYRDKIDGEKIKYNEKYLVSFYIASEKVKEQIEKEFLGVDVKIFIDNRKYRFVNKTSKRLPSYYYNYDLMYEDFNREASPKSTTLLYYLSNIIENLDMATEVNYSIINQYDIMNAFNMVLNGKKVDYTNDNDKKLVLAQNLKTLRSLCLNVYGLSTLVINHENLYNQYFLNQNPRNYGIYACIKSSYLDYAQKRKNLQMKILETEVLLFSKSEQLSRCNNEVAKTKIQELVNDLLIRKNTYETELCNLNVLMSFQPIIKTNEVDYEQKEKLEQVISKYYEHFNNATTVEAKKKIRKIIGKLIDLQIEEESKYTYGFCNDMKDVLTIIRNCFSHIGRISIGKDRGVETTIVLNDYDSNNQKTGEVICKYIDLINILDEPYIHSDKQI